MSWHLNHKILYYYVTPTSIAQAVDDKFIQLAISIMGLMIFSVTSIFELGLGIATLIKYNKLNNTGQISAKQRAAVILFSAQFLRTIFHASIIIAMLTSNLALASYMQKRLPLIADIYALTGSIFLFLLSKKVRSAYLKFYRNRICFKKFNRISFYPFTNKNTKVATISQKDVIF
uniref:Uncharacterized protein n=1 Tax=Panagrolaimus davidi TaxID=227884 RepID=A0A914QWG7_9BILA